MRTEEFVRICSCIRSSTASTRRRLRAVSASGSRNSISRIVPASWPATITPPPSRSPFALGTKATSS
jgi:hypothetical protein